LNRIPALDGVRGLAILLVLAFHLTYYGTLPPAVEQHPALAAPLVLLLSGWTGVDLFFVLSGYLITTVLLRAKGGPGYFREFYRRRILRIFPAYYLALFVCLVAMRGPLGLEQVTPGTTLALSTYFTNWWAVFNWGYIPIAFQQYWSLAIEEQFYLFWPILVLLLKPRQLALACGLLIVGSLMIRFQLVSGGQPAIAYIATPARLDGLSAGALLALWAKQNTLPSPRTLLLVGAAGLAGAGAIVAITGWFFFSEAVWAPTLGVTCATLVSFAIVGACLRGRARLIDRPTLRFFGKYSYGLYIWHPAVIVLMTRQKWPERVLPDDASLWLTQPVWYASGVALTVALALLSYHGVEAFFLRRKDRAPTPLRQPARASPAGSETSGT
jgi:peptidoglycan/LPS O-acetylase OafA/YrhL